MTPQSVDAVGGDTQHPLDARYGLWFHHPAQRDVLTPEKSGGFVCVPCQRYTTDSDTTTEESTAYE